VRRVQHKRDTSAQQKRKRDADVTDNHRGVRPVPHVSPVEVEPDDEHEEDDANLAQETEDAERRAGEKQLIGVW
jgi:hypothetical protein